MRRSFWDIAYQYGDEHEHWDAPRVPAELLRWLDQGLLDGRVLDVGCGTGTELLHVADRRVSSGRSRHRNPAPGPVRRDLLGIDRSLPGLVRARRRSGSAGLPLRWTAADVTELPLADASVDAVLDRGCLHVVSRRSRPGYAREIARVTTRGGRLLLRGASRRDPDAGFEPLDRAQIEELFTLCGFRLHSVEPIELEARAGNLDGWSFDFVRA